MRILTATLILLAVWPGPARSLNISGRASTSLYSYESESRQDDATSTTHVRAYQGVRLAVDRLGIPTVSFHTFFRGTTDFLEEAETDPRLQILNAYLSWKSSDYRVDCGRQRVYAGVGSGTIDGVRGWAALAGAELTVFAGPLVPLRDSTDLNSWSQGHLWGARIATERFLDTAIAVSLAERQRQPAAYDDPGRYSGFEGERSAVVQRLAGIDLNRRFAGGHSLYGRLDFDLKDEQLRRVEASGRYALSSRVAVRADWYRRKPSLFHNSILGVFSSDDYQEVGARLYYNMKAGLRFTAHIAHLLYDGDSAQRLGVTASVGQHYSLGYYRSMGYAGASDGLVGSLHYALGRRLLLRGALDLAAYERYQEVDERDELVTGSLGLTYRATRKVSLDVQAQGLRNPHHSSSMRLFVRGNWRFFRGEK